MNAGTVNALKASFGHVAHSEHHLARAAHQLHFANAQTPLPAGALDILEDLVKLQESAARLRRALEALADGKAMPS